MFFALLALLVLVLLQYVYLTVTFKRSQSLKHRPAQASPPPWLPYLVPGIGHALSFLRSPLEFVKPLRTSVRLRLPTINPFLVQGAQDIRSVFKQSNKTNPGAAQKFIAARLFGMPRKAADTFAKDVSGYSAKPLPGTEHVEFRNRICYRDHELLHSLLQGKELASISSEFHRSLLRRFDALPITEDWIELEDLFDFLVTHITPSAIESFFGPALTEVIDPTFVRDFWRFDEWVPAIAKRAPGFLVSEGFRLRDKLLNSVERWRNHLYTSSDISKQQCAPSILAKFRLREADGWDMRAVAASDFGLIWASNSNTLSALFWLQLEILRSPHLRSQISGECEDSILMDASNHMAPQIDLSVLLQQPYLQASYAEVLRQRNHIFITRAADRGDLQLAGSGTLIPRGSTVIISSTVPHMDETLWNTGDRNQHPLESFWPERFLKFPEHPESGPLKPGRSPSPYRRTYDLEAVIEHGKHGINRPFSPDGEQPPAPLGHPSPAETAKGTACALPRPYFSRKGLDGVWIPFGGGSQMCPGRNFAKTEIFLSVALLLTRFDFQLCEPAAVVETKLSHFGVGVSKPASPVPFRIRRKRPCDRGV